MPEDNTNKDYKVRDKSQYAEKEKIDPEKRKDNIFTAFLKRIRNVFRAIISYLDRITGYKYGNIQPYEKVIHDAENTGKTKEEIEQKARDKGLKAPELSKEAKSFENFLNNTIKLSMDCDNISVIPKQYRSDLNVLDVHVFKDGKETIFSISPEGNGLMRRDRYPENALKGTKNYGSLADIVNGAYAEFKNINYDKDKTQEKIAEYIEDNLTLSLKKNKVHSFMVNGVLLNFKMNGNTLTCTPKYSKGERGIFEANAGETIKMNIMELNHGVIKDKFKNIIEYSNKDAREFFDIAKDVNKGKIFVNFLNSQNPNEKPSFDFLKSDDKSFVIKFPIDNAKANVLVEMDLTGNVISNPPNEVKQYLESAYAKYAAEYGEMKHVSSFNAEQGLNNAIQQAEKSGSFEYSELGQNISLTKDKDTGKYALNIRDSYLDKNTFAKTYDTKEAILKDAAVFGQEMEHGRNSRAFFFKEVLARPISKDENIADKTIDEIIEEAPENNREENKIEDPKKAPVKKNEEIDK